MAQNFSQSRNVELSLMYYLSQSFTADWNGITVAKTFQEVYATGVTLPIVLVRLADTQSIYKEVGATTLEDRYLLIIDVFATSDAQRLDLAYYIKSKLKDGWVHYDHARPSGDTTGTLSRTANGRCMVTNFVQDARIDFADATDTKDKFRQNVSVQVRKST